MAPWLYDLNVFLTALFAGFLASYCVVLGRYFNYLLLSGQKEGFSRYYRGFRESSNAKALYGVFMLSQTVVAFVSLLLNWQDRPRLGQVLALVCLPLLMALHHLVGFARSEETVNSGRGITPQAIQRYLRFNLPLHTIYALLYSLAALLLLMVR